MAGLKRGAVFEPIRVVQVSDTHLSHRRPHFVDNWHCFSAAVAAAPPRLVINTGDCSLAGCRHPADLVAVADLHRVLPVASRILAGNHDVGDHPRLSNAGGFRLPITESRLQAYRDTIGPDRWIEDLGGWRLIGINSLLMGSELRAETEQWRWLQEAIASAGERLLALFLHKPPFVASPDERELTYWSVDPASRSLLLSLMDDRRVRLVGCGHLHEYFRRSYRHVEIVCCPSLAYVVSTALQPQISGGARKVGFLEHVFHEDRVVTRPIMGFELTHHVLDEVVDEVYPEKRLLTGST